MLEPGMSVALRNAEGRETGQLLIKKLANRGGQGSIYAALGPDKRPVAIKVPTAEGLLSGAHERHVFSRLPPHKNVIRLLGTCRVETLECPVFPYAHRNPFLRLNAPHIKERVRAQRWGGTTSLPLPASTAVEMVQEVAAALEHMHEHGYVHGDVKAANVLVEIGSRRTELTHQKFFSSIEKRAYNTVVVDFGSVRGKSVGQLDAGGAPGVFTPLFSPPEMFFSQGSGPYVDVYQLGLLFYQLIAGHMPCEHRLSPEALSGLSESLIRFKEAEADGRETPFNRSAIEQLQLTDVRLAEAYQSQGQLDGFRAAVLSLIECATHPDPAQRPSMGELRRDMLRLFQMQPPPTKSAHHQVSVYNARWQLTRRNRLELAAEVPEPSSNQSEQQTDDSAQIPLIAPPPPPPRRTARMRRPTRALRPRGGVGRLRPPPATRPSAPPPPLRRSPPQPQWELGPGESHLLYGRRVGLVCEDKTTLEDYSRLLRQLGCEPRVFQDPVRALESVSKAPPDVLLVDVELRGLIDQLRLQLEGLPFPLFVLADEGHPSLPAALALGARAGVGRSARGGEVGFKLVEAIRSHDQDRLAAQIPTQLEGFQRREELGRGELSVVYRVVSPERSQPCCAKVLHPQHRGEAAATLCMRREINVLSACQHPAFPPLILSGLSDELLFYVTDELPQDSLAEEVRKSGPLPEPALSRLLGELASGLDYLHSRQVLLGDLSPARIGRRRNGSAVFSELGSARWLGGSAKRHDEPELAISHYAAPERDTSPPQLDLAGDVYSLAVCALEIFTGLPALPDPSGRLHVAKLAPGLSRRLADLLEAMLAPNPAERVSASELARVLRVASPRPAPQRRPRRTRATPPRSRGE